MPNPPWITGPHLLPAEQPRDLFESKNKDDREETSHGYLTDKVRGGRGWRAMRSIVASITRLRDTRPLDAAADVAEEAPDFSIHLEHASRSRRAPWTKAEEKIVFPREKKAKLVTAAELTLPEPLLLRLRGEAREMTKWVKAKKAGVTQDVVNGIKMAWRRSELAMVKIVDPLCRNMDRAREIVEVKTGGLVVWSKKDTLVVYRGIDYQLTAKVFRSSPIGRELSLQCKSEDSGSVSLQDRGEEAPEGALYDREANRLLDGLGPRFIDWWQRKPLPVDADLLPEVVPDFMTPFRMCPPRVRRKLTDDELTYLRMLAHPLPTHFALGKNTKLQGLASAILKLWEKSLIAKIAVKIGIENTDHRQMSSELKLKKKIRYSEAALANLSSSWTTSEQVADQELLTEEERQTFLKIGLKMDAFLLLGRRGIYDGIIGSIHQHWKHREVVNVITMQKSFQQIMYTAKLLEVASGGILVGVEKQRKGHAMIFYRGKNYSRPLKLLPENLLTKKQALQRSIEIQRRGSLKYFAYRRHLSVLELKQRLREMDQRAKDLIITDSNDFEM